MVVIQNGNGPWTNEPGDKPGLYARFIEAAIAAIGIGSRGKVATIKAISSGGTAEDLKVYRISKFSEAEALFGEGKAEDIKYLFIGGASEVVVSTFSIPADQGDTPDYLTALENLETYEFHQFVGPVGADASYKTDLLVWLAETKTITKNFVTVYADNELEGDIIGLKAAKTEFNKDETVVFVANGVIKADGTVVDPDLYAYYVAGVIAGTGLAESITNKEVAFAEPSYRYKSADVKELLAAGFLVTEIDGDDVSIVQGLTLGEGQYRKIRIVKAKHALLDDIDRTTKKSYVGKITNHDDGKIAIINGVKQYLTTLAAAGVINPVFQVGLDPENISDGDKLYILLNVNFLDSVEYVKLTVIARTTAAV